MVKLDVKQGEVWAHFTCNLKSFSCNLSAIRTARWFVSAYLESDKTQPSGEVQPASLPSFLIKQINMLGSDGVIHPLEIVSMGPTPGGLHISVAGNSPSSLSDKQIDTINRAADTLDDLDAPHNANELRAILSQFGK